MVFLPNEPKLGISLKGSNQIKPNQARVLRKFMRFILLNQFYPPYAAPTGWYLHGLARELVRRGHFVNTLCSRCSYQCLTI
jgi:hypothetical protein